MNTNKNDMRWWIVFGVVLVVYNALAFALPFPKTAGFLISYLFSMIAILAQIYVIRAAFYQGEGVRSKFYGFPIAKIGFVYLITQIILGFVFMALGAVIPLWLPLVLYAAVLGAAAIGLIAADAARDEVERQGVKLEKNTSRMRALQAQGRALVSLNKTADGARPLEQLAESLRFSDPVSSAALADLEDKLEDCLAALQQAVSTQNAGQITALCQKTEEVLAERNQLCKLRKS